MKPIRVSKTKPPRYPAKLEALADPDLLARHLPPAWTRSRELMGAAAVAVTLCASACQDQTAKVSPKVELERSNEGNSPPSSPGPARDLFFEDMVLEKGIFHNGPQLEPCRRSEPCLVNNNKNHLRGPQVAPIFEHGPGRGVTGCVVVTAPAFLSEEEALQVIFDELQTQGLCLDQINLSVPRSSIEREWIGEGKAEDIQYCRSQPGPEIPELEKILSIEKIFPISFPLELPQHCRQRPIGLEIDAYDSCKKVAVEFVSYYDTYDLQDESRWSSVQSIDTIGAARHLSSQALKNPGPDDPYYLGVFYDPVASYTDWGSWGTHAPKVSQKSRELLRLQVKDFVDWLKAQGAI